MTDQKTARAIYRTVLANLTACCDECRNAPGSPQAREAAAITRALHRTLDDSEVNQ